MEEDIQALNYFGGFLVAIFFIPLLGAIPYLDQLKGLRNINSLGYQIGLGGLVISSLLFFIETRKIDMQNLGYFSRSLSRFNADIFKLKKVLFIGTIALLIVLAHWEYRYRGQWLLCTETALIFVIYLLILYNFGKVLFEPSYAHIHRPEIIYLPSIKSKRTLVIGVTFFVLYLFIFVITSFGKGLRL